MLVLSVAALCYIIVTNTTSLSATNLKKTTLPGVRGVTVYDHDDFHPRQKIDPLFRPGLGKWQLCNQPEEDDLARSKGRQQIAILRKNMSPDISLFASVSCTLE